MAKRGRNLAALAALGALGYMATRGGKGSSSKGEDADLAREIARAERGPVASLPGQDAFSTEEDADLARETARAGRGPVASLPGQRATAPASSRIAESEDTTSLAREIARAGRGQIVAKDKSTTSTLPGTMGGYVSRAGTRAGPSAQAQFEAADRAARTPEAVAARQAQIEGQALGRVSPEEYLGPGAGLKGAAALAKKLASYTPKSKAGKEMMQEQIPMTDVPRLAGPPKALPAPRPAPKGDASQRVRGGRTRFNEDEVDLEFKRGGKVKKMASGGSTSSGYHRGDGIAQRGKTKGRMY